METGGDDNNGGWLRHTPGICASCVAVLAVTDLSVRVGDGVTAALIPPMLVFAGLLLRWRPLAIIVTLSLADLLLLGAIVPASRLAIVIVGVIALAVAGGGVWLRRYPIAPFRPAHDDAEPKLNGHVMLTGRLQQPLYAEQPDAALTQRLASLSRREQDVARLVLDGLPTREIAQRLFISERTVETHLANIFDKLDVHSRGDLVDSLLNRISHNGKSRTAGDAPPSRRLRRR
jgi:DNA-binding CsgD family transcriptional regulator